MHQLLDEDYYTTVKPQNIYNNNEARIDRLDSFAPTESVEPDESTGLVTKKLPTLSHYAEVTNHNHKQSIEVSIKEILFNLLPKLTSYGVGAVATLGYIGVSQNAAQGNIVNYYMNPIGSVALNCMVNGYFFDLVLSSGWNAFFTRLPPEIQKAMADLKNLTPGARAKILRGATSLGIFLLILGPAVLSAYPAYVLDKTESHDSEFTADVVIASTTGLQFKGVEALFYQAIPTLIAPIGWAYRKLTPEAMVDYKIKNTISAFKAAHKAGLGSAHRRILGFIQTKNREALKEIYPLLMKKNPTKEESMELLLKLLNFAQEDEYQSSPIIRTIVQIVSLILTTASLPGFFLKTKEAAADYANLHEAYQEWLLGSAIFLVSVALSFAVGWDAGGDLYDIFSYTVNGIKESWRNSTSAFDFVKKAWKNKFNLSSWHNLIKLPLSVQQNPRIMLTLIGFLYTLSYWSTQASVYLNEETLGKEKSKFLELPTVISVMIFNSFPVDKVLGSAQQFLMRIFGGSQSKEEIKLQDFIANQRKIIDDIDDAKFLEIVHDIKNTGEVYENEKEVDPKVESKLFTFFGKKTPKEIFGEEHKYKNRTFSHIVKHMKDKEIHKLSNGFFSNRSVREVLGDEEVPQYGTKLKSTSLRSGQ